MKHYRNVNINFNFTKQRFRMLHLLRVEAADNTAATTGNLTLQCCF